MTVALTDLLVAQTKDQIVTIQLNLLTLAGFPATSWQSGSVPLTLVQADAQTLSDMTATISLVAAGGLLDLSSGGWLDLLATSHYNQTRKPAVFTQGTIVLTDTGGGGPYTITANQLWAGLPAGVIRFNNTAGGTLPKNGTLSLAWQAEFAGVAYNQPNGAVTSLLTPLPGVTVANPDPGTGTWVTQQGVDAEADASLKVRCKAQWPTLGGGATALVYQGWALTAAPTVTRVNVLENTPAGGQVTIYCAGPSAGSSSADVATVAAYIATRRPLCVTVTVSAASNLTVAVTGTVTVQTAFLASAQAAFAAAVTAYTTTLAIGATVKLWDFDNLLKIQGVTNVTSLQLNATAVDINLATNQAATFTISGLTWSAV